MKKILLSIITLLLIKSAKAQTPGLPMFMTGLGTPAFYSQPCSSTLSPYPIYWWDASPTTPPTRLWRCDDRTGTWQWNQVSSTIPAVTASIGGSALLAGICTTALTVSVPGAIVGKNVLMTPSDGTLQQSGTVSSASVSSTGVVSYQVCATGLASVTPTAKTYTIQIVQ